MAGTELAKAYVQIVPSAKGIKGSLTSALGGEASAAGDSAGKVAGRSIGSAIKGAIAAAGIGTALKAALTEGANLQQSLGGIETLFKESADKVKENAKNAYKTAGMSANEYMESVTSFSASLLQGLAGDTNKAADVADMALTDMSDNANKMGTSMELIQNAYQGFAKQNYTMLDNLKLGYGGTKTEMQRLLADASKLSGIKYDISNLSDVYEAIHVIQEEMDITGTTAKEAASTFSGSFASMKSAATNLLGNLAIGENINPAMSALISTTGTFLMDNLFPMVGNVITGLVEYIVDTAVNTDWVAVTTQVLEKIRDALSSGISTYFGADTTMVNDMFGFLIEGVPVVAQYIQDAFSLLWEGCNMVWTTVGQPIWDGIMQQLQFVKDNWTEISDLISSGFQLMCEVFQTAWTTIGQPIWDAVSFAISEVQAISAEYMPLILDFAQDMMVGIEDTWDEHLKPCLEAIGNFLNTVLKPVFEFVFDTVIRPLVDNVFHVIVDLWNNTLKPVFDGICDFLTGVFTLDFEKALNGILNIVTGIFNGIQTAIETPMNLAKDIVNSAIEYIKDKFDFDWKFPKIELPHFTVTAGEAPWGFGGKGELPSVEVDWYAKAMNDPMIMNSPTMFGINSLGQIMAGGEAGSEVVSGTDTLMNLIAAAVASQNGTLAAVMDKGFVNLINLLLKYLPQLANMKVVMDSDELVGALATGIDDEMGMIIDIKERGI